VKLLLRLAGGVALVLLAAVATITVFGDQIRAHFSSDAQPSCGDAPYGTERYASGALRSESTIHGLTRWYENGQKQDERRYEGGLREGISTQWYPDGQKLTEASWRAGKKDGLATRWHPNGQKFSEVMYREGKEEGRFVAWHDNGQVAWEATYRAGKREGPATTWNAQGEIIAGEMFAGDVPQSPP
jgi:antitoxin component YwqK of YwqJK toxin-antitoxin module